MKVVLDTNVLLISLPRISPSRIIYDSLRQGSFELIVTNDVLFEYEEIIAEKTSPEVANNVMDLLLALPNVKLKEIYFKWKLIVVDQDDNKFSDCAIAANVDYLVTNDHHFDVFSKIKFPKLSVVSADEFTEILKKQID